MGRRRSIGEGSVHFDAQKDRWVGAMIADGRRSQDAGLLRMVH